jgi:hypothetical protein
VRDVINEALWRGLPSGPKGDRPYRFRLKPTKGKRLPGVDLADRDKFFDLMDGR